MEGGREGGKEGGREGIREGEGSRRKGWRVEGRERVGSSHICFLNLSTRVERVQAT